MLFIYDSALLFGHVNVVFVSDNVMCVHVGTVLFDHAIVVPRIQATALNWIRTSNIHWALWEPPGALAIRAMSAAGRSATPCPSFRDPTDRWAIACELCCAIRPEYTAGFNTLGTLRYPGNTNLDYIDGMAIMFWLIQRREIVVLISLTCSIRCLTVCKRFYTKFHF